MENNKIPMDILDGLKALSDYSPFQPVSPKERNNHPNIKPLFKKRYTQWKCMTSSDISNISKYKPKMLHKISINSFRGESIKAKDLRNLRSVLTSSKRILSISFANSDINGNQLAYLLDSTNHWKNISLFMEQWELIKGLSRLGRWKHLSSFPFPIFSVDQPQNRRITDLFWTQVRKLNQLESLDLHTPVSDDFRTLDYRPPQSLKMLNLDFTVKAFIDQEKLFKFVSGIQQCPQLQYLCLKFHEYYYIEPSDAEIWAKFFQCAPDSLKKLKIDVTFCISQKLKGIQQFIESFQHLNYLTSLHLTFNNQPLWRVGRDLPFLNELYSFLFIILQFLTQLETLELDLSALYRMETKNIQHFASALECLENLKKLSIKLPSLKSPNENFVPIAQSLKQLANLKTLHFDLKNNLNNKSLQVLSDSISHLQLTSLELGIYSASQLSLVAAAISERFGNFSKLLKLGLWLRERFRKYDNLTPFFSDLSKFAMLSHLKLNLSSFQISTQEFKHLSLVLKKLNNLSSISLTLPSFDPKNNFEGLQILLSCLSHWPKLTFLILQFEGENFCHQQIEILSSCLAGCQSLKSLFLVFLKTFQLKDESLRVLFSGIRDLLKLEYLTLIFSPKQEGVFGETALFEFLQGLTVLKNLSWLTFLFNILSLQKNQYVSLPAHLQDYRKLKNLSSFIVGDSRFI